MKHKTLDEIKKFAIERLNQEYGYCGVADAPDSAMLNSGGDGENIRIVIRYEKDEA